MTCVKLNDMLFSLPCVLCLHLWLYSNTHFLALWYQKGEKDMINLCMYQDAMLWIDATNMFVKHDVEQVQRQRKNYQYT